MPAQTDEFIAALAAEVRPIHAAVLRVRFEFLFRAAGDELTFERGDYMPSEGNSNRFSSGFLCVLCVLCASVVSPYELVYTPESQSTQRMHRDDLGFGFAA